MNEKQALAVADALNGYAYYAGGDRWYVEIFRLSDSHILIIIDDMLLEYEEPGHFGNEVEPLLQVLLI